MVKFEITEIPLLFAWSGSLKGTTHFHMPSLAMWLQLYQPCTWVCNGICFLNEDLEAEHDKETGPKYYPDPGGQARGRVGGQWARSPSPGAGPALPAWHWARGGQRRAGPGGSSRLVGPGLLLGNGAASFPFDDHLGTRFITKYCYEISVSTVAHITA